MNVPYSMNGPRPPAAPASGARPARLREMRRLAIPLLLAASGWLALAITVLTGPGALRFVVVFAFALVVPGLAVVRLLPLGELLTRAVLSVAVSMSLVVLTAEAAYIAHVLTPAAVMVALAAVCTVAAGAGVLRDVRTR